MKYINVYGKKRHIGKKASQLIRKYGDIPCILYGKDIDIPIPFSISLNSMNKFIYQSNIYYILLEIEGEKEKITAVKKEIQFDPVSDNIIHVDFFKINENKPIILDIPIKSVGRSIGIAKGGVYYSLIRKLKIKTLPKFCPEYIEFDISNLDIGDKIVVKDIYKNKKYIILHSMNTLIAKVKPTRIIDNKEETLEKNKKESK
ncbi:50S ribosomal protein L25 [Blattabacterium cuenoti]|uniref:50S ribosomal protein L25 n=1 Tax=Blattabacterium cuenoti TaxID=1653831 RepID=UPI00163BDA46|nr:50S ribosomal protein L25 [Blattabacterium cuenoti]